MTVTTRGPTANSGTGWTNPANAYSDDANYATCSTRNVNNIWATYGFTDPGGATDITSVRIGLKGYQATGGDDQCTIAFTVNNSTYTDATGGAITMPVGSGAEATTWRDITSQQTWTWTLLNNTNFKVRVTTSRTGGTMSQQSLNWIPVEVTYTTPQGTTMVAIVGQ
jgi:hypothetical protein